ncbi:MAG: 4-hydroxy-tetrahydrodipicolinate synthase [Acidimicrobiia bacterium]|nr:4-hydroxy-tetrahydrodipicolinate synthase [Acidimicrobiia bacterium]
MTDRPQAPFGSVLTAIVTPFTDEGSVDYSAFWKLIRHLGKNGSDGVVVAGTTGESPTLSKAEKLALFKAAVDAAGDSMTVVAGVGTYDTKESIALAEAAAKAEVTGIMAVTPYYSKPPQRGIVEHMTAIADATDLPMMLYNIPGRTASRIEVDTMVELAGHARIVCVKDAVDDLSWSVEQLDALPADFAVYSGSDAFTRRLVKAGAVGVVSVASHLVGREIAEMVQAVIKDDGDRAVELDGLILPVAEALFSEPNPMPLKAALNEHWGPVGQPRLPLVPASDEALERVTAGLDAIAEFRSQ